MIPTFPKPAMSGRRMSRRAALLCRAAALLWPLAAVGQDAAPVRSSLAAPADAPAAATASETTVAAPSVAATGNPAGRLSYSNKWRIEVSEGANSAGTFVFRLTPRDGVAQDVRIPIKDGTSENRVARRLRDGLERQLDRKTYTVEMDDGEDVLLKKRLGKPDFALELVSSDVRSVRINLDKE